MSICNGSFVLSLAQAIRDRESGHLRAMLRRLERQSSVTQEEGASFSQYPGKKSKTYVDPHPIKFSGAKRNQIIKISFELVYNLYTTIQVLR